MQRHGWRMILTVALVGCHAHGEAVFTNGLSVNGQFVDDNGMLYLSVFTNRQADALIRGVAPSVGQMAGVNPVSGAPLTANEDLLTLRPKVFALTNAAHRGFVINANQITNGTALQLKYQGSQLVLGVANGAIGQAQLDVVSVDARYLTKAGGVMTGALNLSGQRLGGAKDVTFDNGELALGRGTNAHCRFSGASAGAGNKGAYVNALGSSAAYLNLGAYVNAFGAEAACRNSATDVNAVGSSAAKYNRGAYVNALGTAAGYTNTGSHVNALGYSAARLNKGSHVNALGYEAAYSNTVSYVNAFGRDCARGNTQPYLNAFGYRAAWQNAGLNVNALGFSAGERNAGQNVNALGYMAAYVNGKSHVNALGYMAGSVNSGQYANVVGPYAGYGNRADHLSALGYRAGYRNSGDFCFFAGKNAGEGNTAANVIAIGEGLAGPLLAQSCYLDGDLRLRNCNGKGGGTALHFANGATLTTTATTFNLGGGLLTNVVLCGIAPPRGDIGMGIYTNTP